MVLETFQPERNRASVESALVASDRLFEEGEIFASRILKAMAMGQIDSARVRRHGRYNELDVSPLILRLTPAKFIDPPESIAELLQDPDVGSSVSLPTLSPCEAGSDEALYGRAGNPRLIELVEAPHLKYVEALCLSGDCIADDLTAFLSSPALARLRSLSLSTSRYGVNMETLPALPHSEFMQDLQILKVGILDTLYSDDFIESIARSPGLSELRVLEFGYYPIEDQGGYLLAESKYLKNLQSLCCEIEGEGIEAIARSETLRNLTHLNLCSSKASLEGIEALSCSTTLINLTSLGLRATFVYPDRELLDHSVSEHEANLKSLTTRSAEAMRFLSQSNNLRTLRSLDLSLNLISPQGACMLADSPTLTQLESLCLSDTGIGDEGVAAIVSSSNASRLQELDLSGEYRRERLLPTVGNAGIRAISESEHLSQLESLNLACHELGAESVALLFGSDHFPELRTLILRSNRLGASGIERLAHGIGLERLEALDLSNNQLTSDDIESLAATSWVANLIQLDLRGSQIDRRGAQALAHSPYLTQLRRLDVRNNRIDHEALESLNVSLVKTRVLD